MRQKEGAGTIGTESKRNNKNIKLIGRGSMIGASQAVLERKSFRINLVHPCATIMNIIINNCLVTKA